MTLTEQDALSVLPVLTANLPGVGGGIKVEPEDFVVEEIPAYLPSGAGEHLFLWVEKRDTSADYLLRHLARTLGISVRDIGMAGRKDRRAITRQWVSVPSWTKPKIDEVSNEDVQILDAKEHGNKLRTGHLKGNRFEILVRDAATDGLARAEAIIQVLKDRGFPNFFGPQRFGIDGSTIAEGLQLLSRSKSKIRRGPKFRLQLNAVQSFLFNEVLSKRLKEGLVDQVLLGDVLQVVASGGAFYAEDLAKEQQRVDQGEVVITGPLFGPKMKAPLETVAQRETEVLKESGLQLAAFSRFTKLTRGARRPFLIRPEKLDASDDSNGGLRFSMTLPPGCYATVTLRELMKSESSRGSSDDLES